MLDSVINLLDGATDFSWASAKACHAVLLCRMEQGEIQSWSQTDKIDRVCRAHAQKHLTGQGPMNRNQDKSTSSTGRVVPCIYFNKGVCMQTQTHEINSVLYKHICSSCCSKEGKSYIYISIYIHISALMTRDKSSSDCRRTVFDVSFPKGYSVNDGVLKIHT